MFPTPMIARHGTAGMSRLKFWRKMAGGLGNDFQRPRYGIELLPITLELLEREPSHEIARVHYFPE
jgi:hypothetical protein